MSTHPEAVAEANKLKLQDVISFEELSQRLKHIELRGIYDENGRPVRPYAKAIFSLLEIQPPTPREIGDAPEVVFPSTQDEGSQPLIERLWTPQPTIYGDQLFVLNVVHEFLKNAVKVANIPEPDDESTNQLNSEGLMDLSGAVEYEWPGRGTFHIMPPIIERHRFTLDKGLIDTNDLHQQFSGCFVKDAKGNLHPLYEEALLDYYVDHESRQPHLHVFNPQISLFDYGRQQSGEWPFDIICDGAHRVHLAIEQFNRPITAIHVDLPKPDYLLPYYALPRPFHPATRLSSRIAESMYPVLENDKIHLMNGPIRKTAHYRWDRTGMNISSLRSKE